MAHYKSYLVRVNVFVVLKTLPISKNYKIMRKLLISGLLFFCSRC
ncbi:hypothetical protein [Escherichia phage vB-Eco-KMB46]|nr:hypothetical protein [Escherichia phage vB-Eco-KMB46]